MSAFVRKNVSIPKCRLSYCQIQPDWVKVVPAPKGASTTFCEGVLFQRVADAIKACEGSVMGERLAEAAKRAPRGWSPPANTRT